MTDDELKELVASLAVSDKKLKDSMAVSDKKLKDSMAVSDKKLKDSMAASDKELKAYQKETAIQMKETDRKLDKIAKMIGGVSKSQGDVAEDFFYNSFIKDTHLGNLSFDDITKNMFKHRGNIQEEYDIFLTNGDSIAIVEVKYKAHLNDIKKLERKFNNFKKLFPIYKEYKLYGALASFYMNQDTKNELLEQGFFVVERHGDLIKTENSDYLKVA